MQVQSLQDYIAEIDQVTYQMGLASSTTTHAWFRGQSDKSWGLIPSLYRSNGDSFYERELLRDFKLYSTQYLKEHPKNDLEWMFVMQHYGASTRLLDWTESHLMALYFAVYKYSTEADAKVWILDAWSLNEAVIENVIIPTSLHPELKNYMLNNDPERVVRKCEAKYPMAIRPIRSTPRIIAQKGVFTIHGIHTEGLEKLSIDLYKTSRGEINLMGIEIDGKSKSKILKELYRAGISHSVVFPEIEALAKEINYKYSNEYIGQRGHVFNGF